MNSKPSLLTVIAVASLLVPRSNAAWPQQAGAGSIEGTIVRVGTSEPIGGVNVEMRRFEGTAASPLLPPVFANPARGSIPRFLRGTRDTQRLSRLRRERLRSWM